MVKCNFVQPGDNSPQIMDLQVIFGGADHKHRAGSRVCCRRWKKSWCATGAFTMGGFTEGWLAAVLADSLTAREQQERVLVSGVEGDILFPREFSTIFYTFLHHGFLYNKPSKFGPIRRIFFVYYFP